MKYITQILLALGLVLAIGHQPALAQIETRTEKSEPPITINGPDLGMIVSEGYIRAQAREAYFWGWPMANLYNRRLAVQKLEEPGLMDGIVPIAPPNRLSMLKDYIDPGERLVACPNQDVVYGATSLALDVEPAVVQVPDFGGRFWVYQVVDLRTDSFAELGSMYNTKPGFYLLVGPDWQGQAPEGITRVFRSTTNTGTIIPRVFQSDSAEDKKAVQSVIDGIDVYPLSEFTGKMKKSDWSKLPSFDSPQQQGGQKGETKWVDPETFFDELPAMLKDMRPLPGEEARFVSLKYLAELAKTNPAMKKVMIDEAKKTEAELITPLLQFRNFGLPLPHNWGTISNGAAFGADYFTRTAVARSNIFVNKEVETKYFYQDLDEKGQRLNGAKKYTVTLPKGGLPVKGFWSLTLYNEYHFFAPNDLNRYSIGTKSQGLKHNADGSLTIYIQAEAPEADLKANWLLAPENTDFSLFIRAYWPDKVLLDGTWTPPAVIMAE